MHIFNPRIWETEVGGCLCEFKDSLVLVYIVIYKLARAVYSDHILK